MRHYILRHSVLSIASRLQEESIVKKQGLLLESVMKHYLSSSNSLAMRHTSIVIHTYLHWVTD